MDPRRSVSASLIGLCLLTPSAQAWNKFGHMVVAAVAFHQLEKDDPELAKTLVAQFADLPRSSLLLETGHNAPSNAGLKTFMLAATWPDAIKRNPQTHAVSPIDDSNGTYPKDHEGWHYVNIAHFRFPTETISSAKEGKAPEGPNAVSQVKEQVAVLFDRNAAPAERAKALCWVEHLAGDLHQPLHCIALLSKEFTPPHGDSGGNQITVSDHSKNLHAFWDDVVGDGLDVSQAAKVADSILAEHQVTEFSVSDLKADPSVWSEESHKLAKDVAYSAVPAVGDLKEHPIDLDQGYKDKAKATARRQIALAGYRWAAYLRANK